MGNSHMINSTVGVSERTAQAEVVPRVPAERSVLGMLGS